MTQLLTPLAGDKSCVVNERSCTTSEVVDNTTLSHINVVTFFVHHNESDNIYMGHGVILDLLLNENT